LDRWYRSIARHGARILFFASLYMLLAGVTHVAVLLGNYGMTAPSLAEQIGWVGAIVSVSFSALLPAAYLFAASLFVNHLDRWAEDRAKKSE
jgi:hypothetical protein